MCRGFSRRTCSSSGCGKAGSGHHWRAMRSRHQTVAIGLPSVVRLRRGQECHSSSVMRASARFSTLARASRCGPVSRASVLAVDDPAERFPTCASRYGSQVSMRRRAWSARMSRSSPLIQASRGTPQPTSRLPATRKNNDHRIDRRVAPPSMGRASDIEPALTMPIRSMLRSQPQRGAPGTTSHESITDDLDGLPPDTGVDSVRLAGVLRAISRSGGTCTRRRSRCPIRCLMRRRSCLTARGRLGGHIDRVG